jgi:hypothetical protein
MDNISISGLKCSRLILGGNPFSGFSHQSPGKDSEMVSYYTTAQIKATLRQAESLGINTLIARADRHIIRVLREYWDEAGAIQWIAQTCPELASIRQTIDAALLARAKAVFIHGGQMDFMLHYSRLHGLGEEIEYIQKAGIPAGVAGHLPAVFRWAERHLAVDFYMCSYYNPVSRRSTATVSSTNSEVFDAADRSKMTGLIQRLSKPVIHYKIMAAGRNDPAAAFEFAARVMRPRDAVCVGVFPKDQVNMIQENITLLEQALMKHSE